MLVIFDCDGVLVDTETVHAHVLRQCLRALEIEADVAEVLTHFRGKSVAACARQVAALLANNAPYQHWPAQQREAFAATFWQTVHRETLAAFAAGVAPIAGVYAVLQALRNRGVAFCVASNGTHDKMQMTLTHAGLAQFFPPSRRFSATDVAQGKPAPDVFLYAAAKMEASPTECVVVEDSPSGGRAARLAGMTLLGYCPPEPGASSAATAPAMKAEGAQVFGHMDELLPLL